MKKLIVILSVVLFTASAVAKEKKEKNLFDTFRCLRYDYKKLLPVLKQKPELVKTDGADIVLVDCAGAAPYNAAARKTAEILINALGVNKQDHTNGWTPIFRVCYSSNGTKTEKTKKAEYEYLRWLIKKGADPNIMNSSGQSALWCAVGVFRLDIADLLVKEGGADVNLRNRRGETLLMFVVSRVIPKKPADERTRVIKWVLDKTKPGIINVQDNRDGLTALHLAAGNNISAVVKMLLKAGAKVNIQAKKGATPLICAIRCGRVDNVKLLLEVGADTTLAGVDPMALSSYKFKGTPIEVAIDELLDAEKMFAAGKTGYALRIKNYRTKIIPAILKHAPASERKKWERFVQKQKPKKPKKAKP